MEGTTNKSFVKSSLGGRSMLLIMYQGMASIKRVSDKSSLLDIYKIKYMK